MMDFLLMMLIVVVAAILGKLYKDTDIMKRLSPYKEWILVVYATFLVGFSLSKSSFHYSALMTLPVLILIVSLYGLFKKYKEKKS